ncbi:helix-turn-helix domain-containing protein [Microbacterium plantarum]|uniref:Helix-turn-helix domain-containing protein n=1 Tax=Microbacterium plantarum TaxID=1816425 RepID=A0ABV5EUB1_9MICO
MPTGRTPEPGSLSRHVANLLAVEIARRGLRQTDVAAQVGMSASQLSRVLAAKKVFTIDQLDAVCRAVGIPIGQVVVMPGRRRWPGSGAVDIAVSKAPQDDRGADECDG